MMSIGSATLDQATVSFHGRENRSIVLLRWKGSSYKFLAHQWSLRMSSRHRFQQRQAQGNLFLNT
jgi:hypothetical protein